MCLVADYSCRKFGMVSISASPSLDANLEYNARSLRASPLFQQAASFTQDNTMLSHLDEQNQPTMVDVSEKSVVLALGGIAHRAIIRALGLRQVDYKFGHAAEHPLPGRFLLLDSYHCSRYNTNTGRLTTEMFEAVFAQIRAHLKDDG